jgi:hypothetical protein
MSKGLGAVERFIMDDLPTGRTIFGGPQGSSIGMLADRLAHLRQLEEAGETCANTRDCCDLGPYSYPAWPAEYESVRRAVRSLKRKGLVATQWQMDDPEAERPRPYLWVTKKTEN